MYGFIYVQSQIYLYQCVYAHTYAYTRTFFAVGLPRKYSREERKVDILTVKFHVKQRMYILHVCAFVCSCIIYNVLIGINVTLATGQSYIAKSLKEANGFVEHIINSKLKQTGLVVSFERVAGESKGIGLFLLPPEPLKALFNGCCSSTHIFCELMYTGIASLIYFVLSRLDLPIAWLI